MLVVVDHPPVGGFANFSERTEQVKTEHFFSIGAIEPLNIGILVRLSWLNVMDHHASSLGPCYKLAVEKLRPVVGSENMRQPSLRAQPFKYSNQPFPGNGCINLYGQAFAVKVVNNVEGPETFAPIEGITYEVGRPDLVRVLGNP